MDFDLEKRRLGINLEKLDKSLEKLVPKTDRERGVPDHIAQKAEEKVSGDDIGSSSRGGIVFVCSSQFNKRYRLKIHNIHGRISIDPYL